MDFALLYTLLTLLTPFTLFTSSGNLLQSQLPSECDYLLKVLNSDDFVRIEQGTLDTKTI